MFTLSILDQSPVLQGDTPADALARTVRYAQFAEKNGFKRFWVSEHHNSEEVAGSSPEVLVSHILAKTEKIRVGSGGVMLTHYSPFKVAENFHVLSNLAPGRVDLGVGKAPGGLPLATKALQYNGLSDPNDFNKRLGDLQSYINDKEELRVQPTVAISPELILLGGSVSSAQHAASIGITYVFAQFINSDRQQLLDALHAYKAINPNGIFAVSLALVAAPSEEEAQVLAQKSNIYRVVFEDGKKFTLQNEKSAIRFGEEAGKPYTIERAPSPAIYGTADVIEAVLSELQHAGVDEFVIHNPILQEDARLKSLEILSTFNKVTV